MNAKKIDQCWAQLQKREYRAVIDQLKTVEKPTESALVLRAQAYYLARDYREAILDFSKALEMNPANLIARSWRGLAYAQKKNWPAALTDLGPKPFFFHSEFLFEFHRFFWPLRFIDESLRRPLEKNAEKAIDPHQTAYETIGTNERARRALAAKYRELAKKFYFQDRSSPLYPVACKRAAELDPKHELTSMLQMLALTADGRYWEAEQKIGETIGEQLEAYKKSRNKNDLPSREDLANWGVILHELQDFEGSLSVFSEVVPGGPDDCFAHYYSALNWMMLGDLEKSQACFDMMIEKFMFDSWEVLIVPFREQVLEWIQQQIAKSE